MPELERGGYARFTLVSKSPAIWTQARPGRGPVDIRESRPVLSLED